MSSEIGSARQLPSSLWRRLRAGSHGRIPLISQLTPNDCGAACLAMVLGYHGRATGLDAVSAALGGSGQGVSARQLAEAARRFGLRCRGVKLEPDALARAPRGTILHWEMNHFVVLDAVGRGWARIVDPASGPRRISLSDLAQRFSGVALLLEPGSEFAPLKQRSGRYARYKRWLSAAPGYWPRVIALSIVLQLIALAAPAAVGLTIDKVLPRDDRDLLQLLAVGALVALSVQLLTSFVRSSLLLHLRTYMDAHMTLDLNDHLLALPFKYFQRRAAGDLVLRLASGSQIRDVLTSSALSAVLDGTMALVYFVLLLVMAPPLAAIEPIKAMGAERRIGERWADLYVDVLNSALARGRLNAYVSTLTSALGFAGPLALLLTGAKLVLDGSLGTGGMLALSALGSAFLSPVGALVAMWTQLQTLRSYVQRVEDILDTPVARQPQPTASETRGVLQGAVELRQISFGYDSAAAPVLDRVDLNVAAGEFLAIVGASGSGKSTLARVLAGLYEPSSGSVAFDGVEAERWDPAALRSQLGMVTQDARLLASSVRDNVSLYDATVPLERIEAAARLAEIHDDISRLTLGYDTLLSDGGGSLSGGQRQRVSIARALLTQPSLLVLDEATSQLDTLTEKKLQDNLRRLNCTRIVIAHRLSTIRDADRIVVLDGGRIVDAGRHSELVVRCRTYRELVSAQQQAVPPQPQAKAG